MRSGFDKNDAVHSAIRSEMKAGFDRVDKRFERVDQRFDQLTARIDSLQLALVVGMVGIIGAIIASSIFG